VVAKIVRTRGLRGEVMAEPFTPRLDRFARISEILATAPDGRSFSLTLSDWRAQGAQLALRFVGLETVEQAAPLVGCSLQVPAYESIELEANEFFQYQLIGCVVETATGQSLGDVIKVLDSTGTPVLVVRSSNGREHMIPFAASICPRVDVAEGRIIVDPPDGLLEL
jgi:16S rRNA processing protein RimM